jgi:repressor LexA
VDEFTALQGQYLTFIHLYTKVTGRPPAEVDMQRYFGVTPPSVHRMVVELDRKGLLTRTPGPGRGRSIRVTVDPHRLPPLE